jgi:phytoene synthase
MSPDAYCLEKAGGPTATAYYSALFLSPVQRQAWLAVYALYRELHHTAHHSSDGRAAQVVLHWWHQEIDAIYHGTPSHPVARALAHSAQSSALPQEEMEKLLEGAERDLQQTRYTGVDELLDHCRRGAGCASRLAALALGGHDPRAQDAATEFGIAHRLYDIVSNAGADARRGRLFIPQDHLARHHVAAGDVLNGRVTDGWSALMAALAQRAHQHQAQAARLLPPRARPTLLPHRIQAAIQRAGLAELATAAYPTLRQHVELTPLRKLWLAHKTRWSMGA